MRPCATTMASEITDEEMRFLLSTMTEAKLLGKHLEIGTAAGGTLCQMMKTYSSKSRPKFVVVDPMTYFPGQLETVRQNLRNHDVDPETVDFRVTTSSEALKNSLAKGEKFDFIFIDGCHKVRYVIEDLRWAELLNVGGTLCLHDYSEKYPGVWHPVRRFLRSFPSYMVVGQSGNLLALKKTKETRHPATIGDYLYGQLLAPWLQIRAAWNKRWALLHK